MSAAGQVAEMVSHAPIHRHLDTLDRSLFEQRLELLAVSVPASGVAEALMLLKDLLLRQPRLSAFAQDTEDISRRLLVLVETEPLRLPENVREHCNANAWPIKQHRLVVGYDFWSASDIFRAILPEELVNEAPSSFARVGHIAHLNLRDGYLPYKKLIGQVVLDKNPGIRTVVNKIDTIDSEFRFFQMEVLAGDADFEAELNHGGCRFRFDFSKVYWNTRLSTEHARLVDIFRPTDVVADAFAGVGPFALPAAKKGCVVLANDLNPASVVALRHNIALNKLDDRVRASGQDARDFIRQSASSLWHVPLPPAGPRPSHAQRKTLAKAGQAVEPVGPPSRLIDHFVMNLPATALDFLGAFRGLFSPLLDEANFEATIEATLPPLVHCYCFAVADTATEAEREICQRASASLGHPVNPSVPDFALVYVRSVAPRKNMFRLTFRLPMEVLHGNQSETQTGGVSER